MMRKKMLTVKRERYNIHVPEHAFQATHPSPAAHDILHRGLLQLHTQWAVICDQGRVLPRHFSICLRFESREIGDHAPFIGITTVVLVWGDSP